MDRLAKVAERSHLADAREVFDKMMQVPVGHSVEQAERAGKVGAGFTGNFYIDDEVEAAQFGRFVNLLTDAAQRTGNWSVLVATVGDGPEVELLAKAGFYVTVVNFSSAAVEQTNARLARSGLTNVALFVEDVTRLQLSRGEYVGVMFPHVASFIADDETLASTVADLASQTVDGGVFYYSNTRYGDPLYRRDWSIGGEHFGTTTIYARPLQGVVDVVTGLGLSVVHTEQFRSGTGGGDYGNDYLIATR
jgi:hypothetical protein